MSRACPIRPNDAEMVGPGIHWRCKGEGASLDSVVPFLHRQTLINNLDAKGYCSTVGLLRPPEFRMFYDYFAHNASRAFSESRVA
jgi:hypothetical protein